MRTIDTILSYVEDEVQHAMNKHGSMNSPHEGFAVIKEELDELWEEIKKDNGRSEAAMTEATQIAAMAVRYIYDLDT